MTTPARQSEQQMDNSNRETRYHRQVPAKPVNMSILEPRVRPPAVARSEMYVSAPHVSEFLLTSIALRHTQDAPHIRDGKGSERLGITQYQRPRSPHHLRTNIPHLHNLHSPPTLRLPTTGIKQHTARSQQRGIHAVIRTLNRNRDSGKCLIGTTSAYRDRRPGLRIPAAPLRDTITTVCELGPNVRVFLAGALPLE